MSTLIILLVNTYPYRKKLRKTFNGFSISGIYRDAFESLKSGKDRGLSKIRKDIITRPTEGIIDTTEPAFDVANIYVSIDPMTLQPNVYYKITATAARHLH